MIRPEILAPAGSKDALISAISAGCDAIYLGYEKFSARSGARNFDLEDLTWAVSYAHLQDVKIYLTINTIIKNSELDELVDVVEKCLEIGVDAFIIQDIGVLTILRNIFPDIALHSSTQMNIHSSHGGNFVKKLGVERLILARELSLEEISFIKSACDMEVECFAHGALCYCYSGQCLMSSSLGDRSGNRGSCAQPCRLAYDAGGKQEYVMSLKDLSAINILDELVEKGVDSLKIEGRVKTDAYVYKVVSLYRKYLDKVMAGRGENLSKKDYDEILQVYNRGEFSTGFYKVHNDKKLIGRDRPKHQGVVLGEVVKVRGNKSFVKLNRPLKKGDYIEFDLIKRKNVITADKDYMDTFMIHGKSKMGSKLRRLSSIELTRDIESKNGIKKIGLDMSVKLMKNKPSEIIIKSKNREFRYLGDVVEEAKSMPLSFEKVYTKLDKTMDYPIYFKNISLDMDDDIFMPISKINELRREGLEQFFNKKYEVKRLPYTNEKIKNKAITTGNINVSINNIEQYEVLKKYPISTVYVNVLTLSDKDIDYIMSNKGVKKVYGIAPKIVRDLLKDELSELKEKLSYFDGILVNSIDSYDLVSDLGLPIRLDYSLNIFNNETIRAFKGMGVESFMPSLELNFNELRTMNNKDAEILLYGHITTMTSASCIKKTSDRCVKAEGSFYNIGDRKGEKIYYETKCTFCYNKVYNPYPLYLIDKMDKFNKIGVSNFRLDFNFEENTVIEAVLDEVFYGKKCEFKNFTRGHFEKGIK